MAKLLYSEEEKDNMIMEKAGSRCCTDDDWDYLAYLHWDLFKDHQAAYDALMKNKLNKRETS
ncbi:MAG: hypothetical protein EOL87_13830 [Spartobacteria bacterium]|nr:hypothetical protein [Spartobacteria bacterium]